MLIFDKNQTGFLISSISINSQICIFAYYIETSVVYSVSMSKKNVGSVDDRSLQSREVRLRNNPRDVITFRALASTKS